MLNRLAIGCPDCGYFVRGVDILTAMQLLGEHHQAFLLTEEDYLRRCEQMFAEAERAVSA